MVYSYGPKNMNDFHIQSIEVQWHCQAINQCQPTLQKSSFGYRYFTNSLSLHVRNDPGMCSRLWRKSQTHGMNLVHCYGLTRINTVSVLVQLNYHFSQSNLPVFMTIFICSCPWKPTLSSYYLILHNFNLHRLITKKNVKKLSKNTSEFTMTASGTC